MKQRARACAVLVVAVVTGACGQGGDAPVPELDLAAPLPPVAAQYRTRIVRNDDAQVVEWRFWRAADRLVTENLTARTADEWQREGSTIFHKQFFHEDRRGIEFQMDDLRIAGAAPRWMQQALLVDPDLLSALPSQRSDWQDGHAVRLYSGEINGMRWDIALRADLMLPVLIERRQGGVSHRTELIAAHSLDAVPWQPEGTAQYRLIDYADLGDMLADPFVQKVQRHSGGGHLH